MRVRLTAVVDKDIEQAFHWRNKPEIYAWTRQNGTISMGAHREYWDHLAPDTAMVAVTATGGPDAGRTVGIAGLTGIRTEHGTAEFSLYIAPEYQRKGYGKEALERLLYIGFCELRLDLIYGETLEENPALKMFLDIGMTQEAKLRSRYFKNGKKSDVYILSITKEEFYERYAWMVS